MSFAATSLRTVLIVTGLVMLHSPAEAQMPGTPTLQNAFANPGITAALNAASLGGASSYALAGAWAPGSARFQLSAGVGLQTRTGAPKRTLYGARLNVPVFGAASSFGLSAFAGYGGVSGPTTDSSVMKSLIPIGATVSYRLAIGTGHGVSLYGSPIYDLVGRGGGAANVNEFRGALGLDVGITQSIGATIGVELGKKERAGADSGRPSGTSFGAAVSYVIGAK
jgi:hypothetical protein